MPIVRANKFTIMLTDEEKTLLQWLADSRGFDASNYLRDMIRREYAAGNVERSVEKLPPRKLKALK